MDELSSALVRACRDYLTLAISGIDTRRLVEQCSIVATNCGEIAVVEDLISVCSSAITAREVADCRTDECWVCLLHAGIPGPGPTHVPLEWQQFYLALALYLRCIHRSRHADRLVESLVDCVYQLDIKSMAACSHVLRAVANSGHDLLGSTASVLTACAVLSARACAMDLSELSGELARAIDPGYQSLNPSGPFLDAEEAAHWSEVWRDVTGSRGGIVTMTEEIRRRLESPESCS